MRIQILHRLDKLASKSFVGERFAQPVELLDHSIPRHRLIQATLVSFVLLNKGPLVFGTSRLLCHGLFFFQNSTRPRFRQF